MNINEAIRQVMKEKNIGNTELSAKSGIPMRTLSNILSGTTPNPTIDTVRSIVSALGCSLDDISDLMDSKEISHYTDPDVEALAQELYDRPDLRVLFSTTKKVSKEDLEFVKSFVERLAKERDGEPDEVK